jgi:hypothetical protein
MIVVAFQIIFCAEMHVNDIFLFFKNYFLYQHIKIIQNILNFNKKIEFFRNAVCTVFLNGKMFSSLEKIVMQLLPFLVQWRR